MRCEHPLCVSSASPCPGCAHCAVRGTEAMSPGQVSLRCGGIPEVKALALLRDGQSLLRTLTELSTQRQDFIHISFRENMK